MGQVRCSHIPRSLRFITPGALDVVLRFLSSIPATPESTLEMSDVSADMVCVRERDDHWKIDLRHQSQYQGSAVVCAMS